MVSAQQSLSLAWLELQVCTSKFCGKVVKAFGFDLQANDTASEFASGQNDIILVLVFTIRNKLSWTELLRLMMHKMIKNTTKYFQML